MEYMKANFAHDFRTPFSAINVSLSSLQKIFPQLLEGYNKACKAGLMDDTFSCDFLEMVEKSVKNSLNEVKFCDQYLNRLLLLLKDNSLGSGAFESINLREILEYVFCLSQFRETQCYFFSSETNFDIEFNRGELELCLQVLCEELLACKNEQQAEVIIVHIDKEQMELSFEILKSKSNSYIGDCIAQFMEGHFHQRYGLGCYLLNQLLINNEQEVSLVQSSKNIQFLIKF